MQIQKGPRDALNTVQSREGVLGFVVRGQGTKDTRDTIQQFILAGPASDSWDAFQILKIRVEIRVLFRDVHGSR